jgi:hypothetical protein
MSGSTSSSSGQRPPSNSQISAYSTAIYPSGDGKTPQTAAWSPALSTAFNTSKTYVIDGLGLFPRYRRTILVEARSSAQVYTVLDGDTYQVIDQLPAGSMANATMPAASGETEQIAEICAHENLVASGSGPAAEQYNATQVHHGDVFEESGNEKNSSEEAGDGRC